MGIGDWGLGIGDWAQSPIHLQKRLEKLKTLAESLKNENENLPAGRLRIAQRNQHLIDRGAGGSPPASRYRLP